MSRRRKKGARAACFVLLVSLVLISYAGYRIVRAQLEYRAGNLAYEQLNKAMKTNKDTDSENMQLLTPQISVDFAALGALNADIVAWLYCPDTPIDYPVLQAENYTKYLRHLPDGKYNINGSLFFDYHNPFDETGKLSIIYGHNIKNGMMFGTLGQYKRQEYFDEHPYLYLYTPQFGNYRINLLYGCVVDARLWDEEGFVYEENVEQLLAYAARNTTFESNVAYSPEDRVIVLSTCSYEFNSARYFVVGVLEQEQG